MKKLRKIKLINWHTFWNETIEINDNCLVTGENGSGKSTLLDAIQFVLTAGRAKFNQAADDTSKRTLETYIKGKVGYVNKEYLREGDIISYIVLEFFDEEKKEVDSVGVIIEFNASMNKPSRTFFRMNKFGIQEDLFVVNGYIKTANQFKQQKNVDNFNNPKDFQKCINAFLGLSGGEKYFELLPKSLAFKPIKDVNQFVNDFLLSEKKISLESLQQNIENFSKLEQEIKVEEEKIEKLEMIENKTREHEEKTKDLEKNRYAQKIIKREKLAHSIKEAEEKIRKNQQEMKIVSSNLRTKEITRTNHQKTIVEYQKSLDSNEEYRLVLDWEEKLREIRGKQEELKPQVQNYIQQLHKEVKDLQEFSWIKSLKQEIDVNDVDHYEKKLVAIVESYRLEKEEYRQNRIQLQLEKKAKGEQLDRCKEKQRSLQQKKFVYSPSLTMLQKEIKDSLKEMVGKEIEVRPLCEYLEITDENWRNAVEGYLNTQRFDLIIDPNYFDDALQVYEIVKKEKGIHGVGLVNTSKLKDIDPIEGTLATKVTSYSNMALHYALSILNKVVCCEDSKDLKKHENAITTDCMTYRNHVARQINPKVYNECFIGQAALEMQLKNTEKELKEREAEYNQLIEAYNQTIRAFHLLDTSKLEILVRDIYLIRENHRLEEQYYAAEKEKDAIQVDGILNNVLERIDELEVKNNEIKEEIDQMRQEIAKMEIENENFSQNIEDDKKEMETIEISNPNEEWEKDCKEKIKVNDFEKYEKLLQEKEKNLIGETQKLEGKIEELLKSYTIEYQFDQIPLFTNLQSYLDELYRKRNIDIVKRKATSAEFKESCQISFQEDFICKLREQIETAKSEIRELNRVLKPKKFGKEQYEFICKESKNVELANYYRIITSGANYVRESLFDADLNLEDKATLNELFQKISVTSTEDMTRKLLDEYTDYRNYMSYDIKITNDDGNIYYFSKASKEKSGGEIQTPFYVIIASAFEQLLTTTRRTSSTGCIVMFDEAFNNMDESRIEAMMDFYKELNIQLLIAVPSEKVHIIAPYVETTLIVMSSQEQAFIRSVRSEELVNV